MVSQALRDIGVSLYLEEDAHGVRDNGRQGDRSRHR